ncbi:MAG: DUF4326 domain-containing protein [Deltaproteobacteria bacterium]|nr:DUF4326 domain-containing protein [Deltaproteobacteria bacterium]
MIRITSHGLNGTGIYIGRPSRYGNPYPTKRSRFSSKIYPLHESLKLYSKLVEEGKMDISRLEMQYVKDGFLILDCWCIDKIVSSLEDVNPDSWRCHGEILAYHILKNCKFSR